MKSVGTHFASASLQKNFRRHAVSHSRSEGELQLGKSQSGLRIRSVAFCEICSGIPRVPGQLSAFPTQSGLLWNVEQQVANFDQTNGTWRPGHLPRQRTLGI